MDTNTHYWLNRVAVKLYKQFLSGMDFEHNEQRWVFDWEPSLSSEENLKNVAAEDRALIVLTQVGVIKSGAKENYFRDQQLEALAIPGREDIGMWGEDWEAADPAHREYDYIRFIDDLHYDKFIQFCEEQGINYKEGRIAATLEIIDQKPSVRAEGKEYSLKVLQIGSALDVIIVATAHPGEQLNADKLRQLMNRPNAFKSQTNFKQIFRKNEFGAGNVLHPFAEISTTTFTLKKQADLTPVELSEIQKASTN